ncbi:hypothetical protein DAEQUDRAFT_765538 [Daedalea quercina L-15889]|uniref:Uncharacterized protein n=1 Tax=Daedalea quercina L-15889 TaxID=1314783 RepID=A0A165QHE6_9APHY|nr:hypothetical protein DAEQUDRAFT_765538 [Daedalea quercina L-15889]
MPVTVPLNRAAYLKLTARAAVPLVRVHIQSPPRGPSCTRPSTSITPVPRPTSHGRSTERYLHPGETRYILVLLRAVQHRTSGSYVVALDRDLPDWAVYTSPWRSAPVLGFSARFDCGRRERADRSGAIIFNEYRAFDFASGSSCGGGFDENAGQANSDLVLRNSLRSYVSPHVRAALTLSHRASACYPSPPPAIEGDIRNASEREREPARADDPSIYGRPSFPGRKW